MTHNPVHVQVIVFENCLHDENIMRLTQDVAAQLDDTIVVERMVVRSHEEAERIGFIGSPSVRVNGEDIEGITTEHGALRVRTYGGGLHVPTRWQVEAAILRGLHPRGYLFLCVANSARSQMAEGLARSLAPEHVSIQSAGSLPATIHPMAVKVLEEVGIDASSQHSKSVDSVQVGKVDAVITLCAEEVCPVYLHKAWRLHWGMSDPAGVPEEERLDSFRRTRDELERRLKVLFRP